MRYVYIHGFNSGPGSRSGAALERMLGVPVIKAHNDYSLPFPDCIARIEQFLSRVAGEESLCVMGTSLGGFYALQLRRPQIEKIVVWNPVVFPALQLAQFTGENMRFTDGEKWFFSRQALLSYASAADPRVWRNFSAADITGPQPTRRIFIGDQDEVLDPEVCESFWAGHASIQIISSRHSIENFEHALPFLR